MFWEDPIGQKRVKMRSKGEMVLFFPKEVTSRSLTAMLGSLILFLDHRANLNHTVLTQIHLCHILFTTTIDE